MLSNTLGAKVRHIIGDNTKQHWVLFQNGTYILFDKHKGQKDIKDTKELQVRAIEEMKEAKVEIGSFKGDFYVKKEKHAYVVCFGIENMFTYVDRNEVAQVSPASPMIEIGLYGRSKREKDAQNPVIVESVFLP